jgi:hypothetical protein
MKQRLSLSLGGTFLCSLCPLPFLVFFALPMFILSDGVRVLNKHEVSAMPRPVPQQDPQRDSPCSNKYDSLITQAAERYDLSADFLCRVINADGPPGHLRPGVASELGVKNLSDPNEIVPAVAKLLSRYLQRFGTETLAAAAYDAGPAAVQKYHGVPPYGSTRQFVARVMRGAKKSPEAEQQEKVLIPSVIHESEGGFEGTWTRQGNTFDAVWNNGAKATLTIEKFDQDQIVIKRDDTGASVSHNFKATYTGRLSGNSIVDGKVAYEQNGNKWAGTWSARW